MIDRSHIDQHIVSNLRRVLEARPEIHTAILYGGAALGRMHSGTEEYLRSDIDIAVAAAFPLAVEDQLGLGSDLEAATGYPIDLVDLRRTHGLLLRKVMSGGIPIIDEKPGYRLEKAMEMYTDEYLFAPIAEAARKKRIKEFTGG